MIKENIIYAVSAEGIKQTADYGKAFVLNKAGNIEICGYGAGAELEHKKRSHKIGHGCGFKGNCKPEKRAEKEVKGIGADKVCAKIGSPIPADLSAFNKLMGVHIKAYLLAVIVAVIGKNSSVSVNDKPNGNYGADRRKNCGLPIKIF